MTSAAEDRGAEGSGEVTSESEDRPGRDGPLVTTKRSCDGCKWVHEKHYAIQGDSGVSVSCDHHSLPSRKPIGDTTWHTPGWCPVLAMADVTLKGAK